MCIETLPTSSYQISRFSKTRNIWTLIKLYKTYVRSKLEFNTPLWSPHLIKDVKKIEKVQKYFTRRAFKKCNLPYSSYTDRLRQVNMKSLEYRRLYFDLMFMFRIVNGLAGMNFSNYFKFVENPYTLRGKKIKIDPCFKSLSPVWQKSFFCRGSRLWNALPDSITDTKTLFSFKIKLKQFDLSSVAKLVL